MNPLTHARQFSQVLSHLGSIKTCVRLSILITLCSGTHLLPVQAQSVPSGSVIDSVSANVPIHKVQLFVNSSTGQDDVSAGRSEATPFKTITYALGQAQPGMVIQLASGMYSQETGETFPLIVPAGVTLQGNEFNQDSTVTITGGGFYSSSWWGSQNVALLAKADSQIVGVSVTNLNSRGTGIWIEALNVTVRGCTFTKSAREGVFVAGRANPTIENSLFSENSANGVALTGLSTAMVRNNTFQRTGFGIAVSEKAAPQLINNRIQDNVDGIVVSHSATPQLRGNTVEGSKRDGLVAISEAQPDLGSAVTPGRNIFRNNGRFAVYNATLKSTFALEGNDVVGKAQLTAILPSGPDPNLLPEAVLPKVSAGAVPAATIKPEAQGSATPAGQKAAAGSAKLKRELATAPTIKYKGKTYVLLESVTRLAP